MDIQFYGANCVSLSTKQARVIVDDNLAELGAKTVTKTGDIVLATGEAKVATAGTKIVIDQPGEYEVSGVSIYGIAARSHMDEENKKSATMYKLLIDDLRVLVVGHVYPKLTDSQLERIGMVDIMIIPVGGNGYTLDGVGALKLVKDVEPKLVIPTHFEDSGLGYPMPQQPLESALKGLAMEAKETVPKLKIKPADLAETTQLIVLERS
ncbi:MAG TPA: MBL fold metallo-hydrolase [Candidatus Saccharimonadales bacterium]|nr:MBL fold metallo-hydrolase [Candidatus Saccharimonadales bacterium]